MRDVHAYRIYTCGGAGIVALFPRLFYVDWRKKKFMLMQIAAQSSSSETAPVIIWSLVLIVFLVAGFMLVAAVKKRMRDDEVSAPGAAAGFTLSDLRQLHREGQISNEEFERAKEKIIGAAKKGARKNALKPPEEEITPP